MCFFRRKQEIDFDNIVSVVILEHTQLYKSSRNLGLSFGSTMGDSRIIATEGNTPAGTEIKFSVTYKNGKKEIVKAMSGTELYDRLLQFAKDPPTVQNAAIKPTSVGKAKKDDDKSYTPVTLGKNELPAGRYIIGKDIPEGVYDFTWVWGNGSIMKFKNDHDTTMGATNYFEHMGNTYDYEYRQCINVNCVNGEMLLLQGNFIVRISKSKPVELDL